MFSVLHSHVIPSHRSSLLSRFGKFAVALIWQFRRGRTPGEGGPPLPRDEGREGIPILKVQAVATCALLAVKGGEGWRGREGNGRVKKRGRNE